MAAMQNPYTSEKAMRGMAGQGAEPVDWQGEITPAPVRGAQMAGDAAPERSGSALAQGMRTPTLHMTHGQHSEVVEMPTDLQEAYLGSLKAMLNRNRGNYIVATFLIGTQNTVSWEGILYEVGNDFVTIYQPGRDRYIVTDMYSLKYIEFYDMRGQTPRGMTAWQSPWPQSR